MRFACAMLVALTAVLTGHAAERTWKAATWQPRAASGACVLETARDLISVECGDAAAATPGTSVQVAVEGRSVHVLGADKVEHTLRLIDTSAKYSNTYAATGGGHYIKSVAPGGTTLTLEDGSRWDMDPRQYFAVADWQPDDLIAIRRASDDPAFDYEVDNTSQDDGALANCRVR